MSRAVVRPARAKENRAGNIVWSNVWLKIGLSPEQAKLLKQSARRMFVREFRTSARAAWQLLNVALSNIELMELLARRNSELNLACERHWSQKAKARTNALN